jgi:hypothetical protein
MTAPTTHSNTFTELTPEEYVTEINVPKATPHTNQNPCIHGDIQPDHKKDDVSMINNIYTLLTSSYIHTATTTRTTLLGVNRNIINPTEIYNGKCTTSTTMPFFTHRIGRAQFNKLLRYKCQLIR